MTQMVTASNQKVQAKSLGVNICEAQEKLTFFCS
jgi:hypothetical protein